MREESLETVEEFNGGRDIYLNILHFLSDSGLLVLLFSQKIMYCTFECERQTFHTINIDNKCRKYSLHVKKKKKYSIRNPFH